MRRFSAQGKVVCLACELNYLGPAVRPGGALEVHGGRAAPGGGAVAEAQRGTHAGGILALWFGHKLHLIADTRHELPVAFSVERASVSERKLLPRDLRRLFDVEPALAERCIHFSADKGYDQADLKAWLWRRHGIRPVIDIREM